MTSTVLDRPAWAASTKQRDFIVKLATERRLPVARYESLVTREDFTKTAASELINELKSLPYAGPVAAAGSAMRSGVAALEAIVPSLPLHFAIPGAELGDERELVFGRLAKWQGTVYLRELHGAPGGFSKTKFAWPVQRQVVDYLAVNWLVATRAFGANYKVCGKCAAELTDEVSRARGFGPDCWKMLGIGA